ncbi:hypothetical protein [Burkholderia pseudomallei]|uniref:hypothetical protein n=1 Tax=Burkholderia pseudomallei TaxID=28450 RepID=UPI002180741E|nr:hypothetical protein [Burkholderia pseudomallei]
MTFGFNVGIRDGKTTQRLARVRGSRVLRGGHAPQCLRSIRRRTISPGDDRLLLAACCLLLAACCLLLAACCLPLAACRLPLAACRLPLAACCLPLAACRLPLAACRLPLAACRLPLAASIEHRARRASAAHIASRAYATLR